MRQNSAERLHVNIFYRQSKTTTLKTYIVFQLHMKKELSVVQKGTKGVSIKQ